MLLKRLFIGNLPETVTSAEVCSKFSTFGQIDAVDVRSKNGATFAFINLNVEDESHLRQCIDLLNNAKWKGNLIKVQPAKESFLDRLKREQEEHKRVNGSIPNDVPQSRMLLPPVAERRVSEAVNSEVTSKKEDNVTLSKSLPATKDSESDSDEEEAPRPFPPFRGLNSYPELSTTSNDSSTLFAPPAVSSDSTNNISKRFLAIATAPVKQEAPQKIDLNGCDNLQSKLLAIAGVKPRQEIKAPVGNFRQNVSSNLLGRPNLNEPEKANLIAKASPLNFRKKNSDEVRQKSLENRLSQKTNQKEIIKMSLANVLPPANVPVKNKGGKESLPSTLFQDDDDEGMDEDADSAFKVRPQFEGASGERNLELSSKFASYDKRFTLDERFRDNEEEEEPEQQLEDEKKSNFAILSDILGTTVAPKLRPKSHKSVIVQRYDPENESLEPQSSEIEKTKSKSQKNKEAGNKVIAAGEIKTQEKATYNVAENLKELFTEDKQTGGFSLLQSFSNENADIERDPEDTMEPTEKRSKNENTFWQKKNPFKYDSSDSEGEDDKPTKNVEEVSFIEMYKESFFFKKNDKRFAGLDSFFLHSDEKMDDVLYRFNNGERNELKLICKGKIKNTKRKSEKRIATLQRLKRKMKAKKGQKYAPQGSNAEPLGVKNKKS